MVGDRVRAFGEYDPLGTVVGIDPAKRRMIIRLDWQGTNNKSPFVKRDYDSVEIICASGTRGIDRENRSTDDRMARIYRASLVGRADPQTDGEAAADEAFDWI